MKKLIISVVEGIVMSVYTDIYEPVEVIVIDSEDVYDENYSQAYIKNKKLIESGILNSILN